MTDQLVHFDQGETTYDTPIQCIRVNPLSCVDKSTVVYSHGVLTEILGNDVTCCNCAHFWMIIGDEPFSTLRCPQCGQQRMVIHGQRQNNCYQFDGTYLSVILDPDNPELLYGICIDHEAPPTKIFRMSASDFSRVKVAWGINKFK